MDKFRSNQSHITDVKGLSINNTTVISTAAELDEFILTENISNLANADSYWVVSPYAGTIESVSTVVNGDTGGATAITLEIGGSAVTGSTVTIANGSADGEVDTATPTAANTVTAGQAIEIINDGGAVNAVRAVVTILMQRT